MIEIWPLPLDCEPPRYFVKRGALSDDDVKKLMNRSAGFIELDSVHPFSDLIVLPPHDEPLDRLAGMISEDGEIFGGYVASVNS